MESFDIRLDMAAHVPVSGYFARPTNAKEKSLPAILLVHGAGVRSSVLNNAVNWSQKGRLGALALDINAHGIPNGQPEAFYKALTEGSLKAYPTFGRESRETCYFTGMFMRVQRALDFLCSQPQWNGKTLVIYGMSQGGFQAFAGAALDERVTFFGAVIPAGCDHTGMLANRVTGWPKLVRQQNGQPEPAVLETSRYVDCVNFAQCTKAKGAAITVGFIDGTAPPTSIYAAFNALPIKDKTIFNDTRNGHSMSEETARQMNTLIVEQLNGGSSP